VDTTRRDLLVGLFLLITLGVIIGAFLVTSRVLERRIPLYVRLATAEGVARDTRVFLRGLQIGRVAAINPQVDSVDLAITFIARLNVREAFPDGTRLAIPLGTRAVIEQPNPINPPVIRLELPEPSPSRATLQPGDTIDSRRARSSLDALQEVIVNLQDDIFQTLEVSRTLLVRGADAATQAQRTAAEAEQMLVSTRPAVLEALDRLNQSLEHSEALLADVRPRVGPLYDSVTVTLGETHRLLSRLTLLADSTEVLFADTRDPIRNTLRHLERTTVILEHFADQVSRRPTRMLTGVEPPPSPPDSAAR